MKVYIYRKEQKPPSTELGCVIIQKQYTVDGPSKYTDIKAAYKVYMKKSRKRS